jgi:hypothetical protein
MNATKLAFSIALAATLLTPASSHAAPPRPGILPGGGGTAVGLYASYNTTQRVVNALLGNYTVIADVAGIGLCSSPYTQSLGEDANVMSAINQGYGFYWESYWTVSAPVGTDTWYSDGYKAGKAAANELKSVGGDIFVNYVVLDPQGCNGTTPSTSADWANWGHGWRDGLHSINAGLTAALYSNQSQYNTYRLGSIGIKNFVAVSPILNNTPAVSGVEGYGGYYAGCTGSPKTASAYTNQVAMWGGIADTVQFSDSAVDCPAE